MDIFDCRKNYTSCRGEPTDKGKEKNWEELFAISTIELISLLAEEIL